MNQTLKRAITALILLTVAVAAAYSGLHYFIYLLHALVFLMQVETANLLFKKDMTLVVPFVALASLSVFVFNYYTLYFFPMLFISISLSISLLLILYSHLENENLLRLISLFILGFCYVGVLPSIVTKLLMLYNGIYWFIVCLGVVFSGDVAAYFVGRKFGKTKLIPSISPNKTWAGAIGGLFTSVLFGVFLAKYLIPDTPPAALIIACTFAAVMAQAGDFFESLIKRVAGSKDSSQLLPGHGGFLDRFDGVLFALPVFYYIAI